MLKTFWAAFQAAHSVHRSTVHRSRRQQQRRAADDARARMLPDHVLAHRWANGYRQGPLAREAIRRGLVRG